MTPSFFSLSDLVNLYSDRANLVSHTFTVCDVVFEFFRLYTIKTEWVRYN